MALVAEIASDLKRDAAFPAEALEAARLYTEAYAVELAGAAKSSALRAGLVAWWWSRGAWSSRGACVERGCENEGGKEGGRGRGPGEATQLWLCDIHGKKD